MKKNTIYKILTLIFLVGFFVLSIIMIKNAIQAQKEQERIEQLAMNEKKEDSSTNTENTVEQLENEKNTSEEVEDPLEKLGIEVPEKNLDWDKLEKENKDIYAWIYVPNTNIDYPILQHELDDVFYLGRNLDGEKSVAGSIFSQKTYNSKDFTDFNTLLFGHNMRNGSMFNTLHRFEDSTFFEQNRYIFIYMKEDVFVYDIFAAYVAGNHHILAENSGKTEAQRQKYLDNVFGRRDMSAHFRSGVEVDTDDTLLTLVTCINGRPNNRYFVQGVLINPPNDDAE